MLKEIKNQSKVIGYASDSGIACAVSKCGQFSGRVNNEKAHQIIIQLQRAVMNKQIASLFDRFYNIALKDKIQDPLLHSEWNYFQSMLASSAFQRDRINMYLSILEKEKRKKEGISQFEYTSIGYEPKMQKRFSEPVKNNYIKQAITFHTSEQQTIQDMNKNQKLSTPKSKQPFRKISGWDSKQKSQNCSSSKTKPVQQKPNLRRLQQIANNLVRVFEISVFE